MDRNLRRKRHHICCVKENLVKTGIFGPSGRGCCLLSSVTQKPLWRSYEEEFRDLKARPVFQTLRQLMLSPPLQVLNCRRAQDICCNCGLSRHSSTEYVYTMTVSPRHSTNMRIESSRGSSHSGKKSFSKAWKIPCALHSASQSL